MVGSYNYWLVLLSVIVAITASYVGLDLPSRIVASGIGKAERFWLAGGAVALGAGIWSMHFIAMLAYRLPIPMSYDLALTGVSLAVAILVSGFALYIPSHEGLSTAKLLASAVLMGLGILTMHYTGMAAMLMRPAIHYEPWLFGSSCLVALSASLVALWSAFRLRLETIFTAFWKKAGSAAVMGSGIFGMHFTGMAAASFAPGSICTARDRGFEHTVLATTLGALVMVFLMATLLLSAFDAYLAERHLRRWHDERERLGRDLHDNIVQAIYATGLKLEDARSVVPADSALAATQIAGAVEGLNGIIRDIRRYIDGASRPADVVNLRMELERLVQPAGVGAPRFRLLVRADAAEKLTAEQAQQAVQIAREALSNALRHSRATHGTLELDHQGDGVLLEVRDDGVGFVPAIAEQAGRGLRNIQARARQIGARLEIDAAPGRGTRITVRIPARGPGR